MADEDLIAAAADLAVVAEQARMRITMPVFDSNKENPKAAKEFFERFDGFCTIVGYTNVQKATALRYALSGVAQTWWNTEHESSTDMMNWVTVQTQFKARFYKDPSPRFIDEELGKLSQRKGESVRSLLDRVKGVVNLFDQLWPIPGADNDANRAAKTIGNQLVHDKLVLQFFLRHLRADIKSGISQAPGMITLDDYVTAAVRAEDLLAEAKPGHMQQQSQQVANTEESAALNQNQKKKKNKQKGQQQPSPSTTSPN